MTDGLEIIYAVLAALNVTLVLVLLYVFHSRWEASARWFVLLLAYFMMRAAERLAVILGAPEQIQMLLALVVVPIVLLLIFGVPGVARRLARDSEEALRQQQAYERARQDFEAIARHRLANPITVLVGGLTTLRDLDADLDPARRAELIDAMLEQAHRLEATSLLEPPRIEEQATELRPEPEQSE